MASSSSTRTAVIASLHFAPVFASHMIAYARALHELGFDVVFILHPRYIGFADFETAGKVVRLSQARQWLATNHADFAIFANAAILNPALAARLRFTGTDVRYVFHEPDTIRNHIGESTKDLAKFAVASMASILMLFVCTGVFLPSRQALELYTRHFAHYNRNAVVLHLLFEDEAADSDLSRIEERRFFSFLGYASKAHDFDAFVEFVKSSIRANCEFPFLIATRSSLDCLMDRDREFREYVAQGKVHVRHGEVLPVADMDSCYRQSFCVWNVYRCSTQSGVLPRSFMNGTPVLANHIGSFPEFVQPGVNGEFVGSALDHQAILDAAMRIRDNLATYVAGCRDSFKGLFHYNVGKDILAEVLRGRHCSAQFGLRESGV